MAKIYYPKRKADYSIQFRRQKGVLWLTETGQNGNINDPISMRYFGEVVAFTNLLDEEEKECFAEFCRGYLQFYKKEDSNVSPKSN